MDFVRKTCNKQLLLVPHSFSSQEVDYCGNKMCLSWNGLKRKYFMTAIKKINPDLQ